VAKLQLEPVEHDPFADDAPKQGEVMSPATMQQVLGAMEKTEQRLLQVELAMAHMLFEIRGALAGMGANVQALNTSHEKMRQTFAAPKRIVRDEAGRPTGVVVDQSLH
jgi:hypothetical protein